MRPRDTSPEAHRVQLEILGKMDLSRRLELALEFCDMGREILIDGILLRDPALSREHARLQMLRQVIGEPLFSAAFGARKTEAT